MALPDPRKASLLSQDPRSQALAALSQFLVTEATLGETLQHVAEITMEAMPAAGMCGISMLDPQGRPTTAIFTDPESPVIDAAQYASGRGPCLDSWRTMQVVRIDDMTAMSHTYPDFSQVALQHGVLSMLSLPLSAAGTGLGALNLYARTVRGFSGDDEAIGRELVTTASVVLANATAYWNAYELSEHLTEAMRSRAVIEQAKGMLMARSEHLAADDAFDILRKISQRENVKLRDIALQVVERRRSAADLT
jgi:GAF domain-containing protein